MGTETEVLDYRYAGIEARWEYARRLSAADELLPKAFRGIIRPEGREPYQGVVPGKVMLILETGRMLGIDPMAAIQGINVIEGSASIAPSLMQALVRRAGHKMRVVTTGTVEGGDIQATCTITRSDEPDDPYTVTWTIDDAIRARLVDSYEKNETTGKWEIRARSDKDNALPWETYTRSLLKWRSQSECVRDACEDVLMGVHYTPEELGVIVHESGTVDVETGADFDAKEAAAIERVKTITDRADAQAVIDAIAADADAYVWTPRVDAEFAAHMLSVTTDSRPPRDGTPGHTGDPDVDGESADARTDRLAAEGAAKGIKRQCSIGWHDECSDTPARRAARGEDASSAPECKCECHRTHPDGSVDAEVVDEPSPFVGFQSDPAAEAIARAEGGAADAKRQAADAPRPPAATNDAPLTPEALQAEADAADARAAAAYKAAHPDEGKPAALDMSALRAPDETV